MSVARVTTITSRSEVGFEDAVASGISRASETLRGIEAAWVKEQSVVVDGGQVTSWQVTLEVTFVLEP
ncbi:MULTISPECIES: dodecin family protein [unclassified Agrococcus]|uniref:dodecin family protein n=1 Tax=unclassified Agrococcus TaxID=2615065 RepID=UPI00361B22D5